MYSSLETDSTETLATESVAFFLSFKRKNWKEKEITSP